jgi:hypothetical protein
MRKLLFALVMMMTGAFAFGAGAPANAMTAAPVAGVIDVVKADSATQTVHWRRHGHRHWRPYYGYGYRRHHWRPYYYGYRPYYGHRRHHRHHRRYGW